MEEDTVNEGSHASGFAQSPQNKPSTRTSTIEERMGEANQSNIGSWLERKERSPQLMVAAASLAPNIVLVLVIGRSAVAG